MRTLKPTIRGLVTALALAAVASPLFLACDSGGDGETPAADGSPGADGSRVTFVAGSSPRASLPLVGVYVADAQGFFDEQGLEVDIQHASTTDESLQQLADGEAQFSAADAAQVIESAAGDEPTGIVAIAAIGQRGGQGFAVLDDSGINTPSDWEGRRAGYTGGGPSPDFLYILDRHGIDQGDVETVAVEGDPEELTDGEADVLPVSLSDEPYTLQEMGAEVTVFEATEYGAETLGLTYVTTRAYIQENAPAVTRFLKSVLRGIQYADENRDEALDIAMELAPDEDRERMRFMMETELEAAISGVSEQNGIGFMLDEQWRRLHDYLVEYGGIEAPLDDVTAVHSDFFLRQAYDGGVLNWP